MLKLYCQINYSCITLRPSLIFIVSNISCWDIHLSHRQRQIFARSMSLYLNWLLPNSIFLILFFFCYVLWIERLELFSLHQYFDDSELLKFVFQFIIYSRASIAFAPLNQSSFFRDTIFCLRQRSPLFEKFEKN